MNKKWKSVAFAIIACFSNLCMDCMASNKRFRKDFGENDELFMFSVHRRAT